MNAGYPALLSFVLLVAACDPFHGIMRRYQIPSSVDFGCVESVIAEHSPVTENSYTVEEVGG